MADIVGQQVQRLRAAGAIILGKTNTLFVLLLYQRFIQYTMPFYTML